LAGQLLFDVRDFVLGSVGLWVGLGWVESVIWWVGLGWVDEVDPRTTLLLDYMLLSNLATCKFPFQVAVFCCQLKKCRNL